MEFDIYDLENYMPGIYKFENMYIPFNEIKDRLLSYKSNEKSISIEDNLNIIEALLLKPNQGTIKFDEIMVEIIHNYKNKLIDEIIEHLSFTEGKDRLFHINELGVIGHIGARQISRFLITDLIVRDKLFLRIFQSIFNTKNKIIIECNKHLDLMTHILRQLFEFVGLDNQELFAEFFEALIITNTIVVNDNVSLFGGTNSKEIGITIANKVMCLNGI